MAATAIDQKIVEHAFIIESSVFSVELKALKAQFIS